ncbi:hypothetical protein Ancab_023117 [Ancistrocladus abbreviatus]
MQPNYSLLATDHINHQQQNFAIPQQEPQQSFPAFPIVQQPFPQQQQEQQKHFFSLLQQLQHEQHEQDSIGLQQQQQQYFTQFQEKESNPLQFTAVNFKLGLNVNSNGIGQETPLLHRNDAPSAKDPFWKPLATMHEEPQLRVLRAGGQAFGHSGSNVNLNQKYRTFGELGAICGGVGLIQANHRTGSGSAITGENCNTECPNVHSHGDVAVRVEGGDHGSEESIGEEALLRNLKKRKRGAMNDQLSSMACFFERLTKKLMDHQEMLQMKFMERIEKLDEERKKREEGWRQQEAEKTHCQAIARANEQALASRREAVILSYFEKITGQKINLPSRIFQLDNSLETGKNEQCADITNNARWPQAEVDALVRVRSSFDAKFREAGVKGPLWDEISCIMGSMGYQRSAKRCKEKWENINKYFRKTKDGVRKRPRQSRTCSYFDQLDQLYSSSVMDLHLSPNSSSNSMPLGDDYAVGDVHKGQNSQLLEAIEKVGVGNSKDSEIRASKLDSAENDITKDGSGHEEGEEIERGEEEGDDDDDYGNHCTNINDTECEI